jgi:DNA-binding LytR/AlgR family response regulator
MRYLIVDDEPIAHQVIEGMCRELSFMALQGNCYDALQALDLLNQKPVDLVFLDIRMPKLGGFDFLRTLERPPQVIVISAHERYALEGYDLNICDYLLKPFTFERFLRAVNKARAALSVARGEAGASLFVKDGKKHHQVRLEDILYVEASGNYCLIHGESGRLMTQEKISALAEQLPANFLRVHKSYIVATDKITLIAGDEIHLGEQRIPIGRVYKPNVLRLLNER